MDCTYRLSLNELITRPAVELRLVGADGEDDKDKGNQSGANSGGNEDDSDKDKSGGDDDKSDKGGASGTTAADRKLAALEEEKQRHYDLRKEAEKELATANAEIARLKKDGTTDEDTKQKLVDNEREISNLQTLNNDLALENTFLKSNKHKWKNSSAALKLADLSKVEIDSKTGSVLGLDAALEALVAENPWLLEADKDGGDEDDKSDKKPKKTGTPPANKGDQDDKSTQATKARLQSKYPGLRR